jgi:hypothetical protein
LPGNLRRRSRWHFGNEGEGGRVGARAARRD